MIIAGSSMFERKDGKDLHSLILQLASHGKFINKKTNWNGQKIIVRIFTAF